VAAATNHSTLQHLRAAGQHLSCKVWGSTQPNLLRQWISDGRDHGLSALALPANLAMSARRCVLLRRMLPAGGWPCLSYTMIEDGLAT